MLSRRIPRLVVAASSVALMTVQAPAWSAEHYVDPVHGTDAGDGTQAHPWKSLQWLFDSGRIETQRWDHLPYDDTAKLVTVNPGAPVKAGDTIWLLSGDYGELSIRQAYNQNAITLAAAPGQSPTFDAIELRGVSRWTIRGVRVTGTSSKAPLVSIDQDDFNGPSSYVEISDCHLSSVSDVGGWSKQDWNALARDGVKANATHVVIRNNHIENVDFGITAFQSYAMVERNQVVNFSGDGMRGLGDHSVFQYNLVKNSYDVNANHDDGFQSWASGDGGVGTGQVRDVTLLGNVFIGFEDPNQKFRSAMQGIGCFDGPYVDWRIVNNVVIVDNYHGIAMLGGENVRIVNNTVVELTDETPGPARIEVLPSKGGTPPSGCLVRNNLAPVFLGVDQPGVMADHNQVIDGQNLGALFTAPPYDLHLVPTSPVIDVGSPSEAPDHDIEGTARPWGAGIDLGAYEYHEADAGASDGAASETADGGEDALVNDAGDTGQEGGNEADASADAADDSADAADASPTEDEPRDSGNTSGCACRVQPARGSGRGLWLLVALASMLVTRRRKGGRGPTRRQSRPMPEVKRNGETSKIGLSHPRSWRVLPTSHCSEQTAMKG